MFRFLVWLVPLATSGLTLLVQSIGLFQTLEWTVYDRFFRGLPVEPKDDRLLLVTLDETDLDTIGWPLGNAELTQLMRTLQKHEPAAIGVDLYGNLPIKFGHTECDNFLKSNINLICVEKGSSLQVPSAHEHSDRLALGDLLVDADGKVRRALLFNPPGDDVPRLSLGVKLALSYLERQGIALGKFDSKQRRYRLGKSTFIPMKSKVGGSEILIEYRGHQEAFRTVSLTQVLEDSIDPEWVRDRVVLVGSIDPRLNDWFYTPLSDRVSGTPEGVPGIVIHANIVSQLLDAALEERSLMQALPEPLTGLWIAVWSSIGALVPWHLLTSTGLKPPAARGWAIGICGLLGTGCLFFVSYGAFRVNWWVPTLSPLFASMASATTVTIVYLRQLQQEREELTAKQVQLERDRLRAEVASQAKSEFLANMSHELRTPLNAILGFTEIISGDPQLNPSHRNYLDNIYRSSQYLLELIDDILDLSKIEAGRMGLEESQFDLHSTIDSVMVLFQNQAKQKGLQLVLELQPDVPRYVKGDRKKLRSCLVNPLSNALKFTQHGSITLRVSCGLSDAPSPQHPTGMMLHVEIQDTGVGIAPEELDRVFEAFVQTQIGWQSGNGTGLGLTITRQFVRLMGGEISIDSGVGEGTRVKFSARITPWERESETVEIDRLNVVGWQPGQPSFRILVVDPDAESRLLLMAQLQRIGFEVSSAQSGSNAIEVWERWEPHLMLLDVQMPVTDALTAIRQIRHRQRMRTTEKPTAIVATIAHPGEQLDSVTTEEAKQDLLASGCDAVVDKPMSDTIVANTIARFLGVCYRYESRSGTKSASLSFAEIESCLSSQLKEMPLLWVRSLNQAANEVNEILVFQLIERIPNDRVQLAECLLALARDFRLDTIVRLTESVLRDC